MILCLKTSIMLQRIEFALQMHSLSYIDVMNINDSLSSHLHDYFLAIPKKLSDHNLY